MALFYLASPNGDYFALVRLFFSRIGDNDPALRGFLLFQPAYEDAVMQRSDIHSHSSTSIQSIPKARTKLCGYRPPLRMKSLLVLLPHGFEVVRFLFPLVGFLFRALPLFQFHSIRNGQFSFCVDPLGVDDESETMGERGADQ